MKVLLCIASLFAPAVFAQNAPPKCQTNQSGHSCLADFARHATGCFMLAVNCREQKALDESQHTAVDTCIKLRSTSVQEKIKSVAKKSTALQKDRIASLARAVENHHDATKALIAACGISPNDARVALGEVSETTRLIQSLADRMELD